MKKSVVTGMIVGLVLTIAGIYPVFSIVIFRILPLRGNVVELPGFRFVPGVSLPFSAFLLIVSSAAGALGLLMLGTVAAYRAKAASLVKGSHAGAISGVAAALMVYLFLVAPVMATVAADEIINFPIQSTGAVVYPLDMVQRFTSSVFISSVRNLFLTLSIGLLLGAVQGALVGWLRRDVPKPASMTLLDVVGDKRGRFKWFASSDEAFKSGSMVGLLGGLLFLLVDLGQLSQTDASHPDSWLLSTVTKPAFLSDLSFLQHLFTPALLTFALLAAIGLGGLAAFMVKNPPTRYGSRVFAATVTGCMVGLVLSFPLSNRIYMTIGLLPQLFWSSFTPGTYIAPDAFQMMQFVSAPQVRVLLMFLAPLPVVALMVIGLTLWGAFQGLVYGLIITLFRFRPVDRAELLRREIILKPDNILPRIYFLFQTEKKAIPILEHLAFMLQKVDLEKAQVAAAYHTLAVYPERADQALDQLTRSFNHHPEWRLRTEVLALHTILAIGLRATTVSQISTIPMVPEDQTGSLPMPLARVGQQISRLITELRKVERVDDLPSKIIFLNNSLELLRQTEAFLEKGASDCCATLYPELNTLNALVDMWIAVVLSAVRDLQGAAELKTELSPRRLIFSPTVNLSIVISNYGLNVAEAVRLEVLAMPGDYDVVEDGSQRIDILPPGEQRQLDFKLRLLNPHPARICWKIIYDDALSRNRTLDFADQLEFVEEERPFQRIFPIPYVTGTPLQSGQMFVGREDVFEFIRQNLIGKYQNNIIVLHGQRRTGKSSILYHMPVVLEETHYCVLIDMQGKAARGEVDFLYSIADDIVYMLENNGIEVELPARKEFEESPEFFFRSRFLRGVYEKIGDKNLLLMFDEFEELQKRVEDGKLTEDIFTFLRNLMQHERRVDFIFAGTHKLEELAAAYWSILFNIALYKKITFLSQEEVSHLVCNPVAAYGLEYDPLAVNRIYQVTSGHPFFTQVLCHELVTYHNETQRSYLTANCVEEAINRIVERGEAHFKYIWAESNMEQRLTLLALAELLETQDTGTIEDIMRVLTKRGRPLDGSAVNEALTRLEARDIVSRSGPRSNLYHFSVDLVRRWIYATRPSYQKVI
jgi:hypothetical protein